LAGDWFVRLASPVSLEGELLSLYESVCAASTQQQWREGIAALRAAAVGDAPWPVQPTLDLFH
jgi:hypothetical protein